MFLVGKKRKVINICSRNTVMPGYDLTPLDITVAAKLNVSDVM
jgi:hypothetical protein